jgi:hypothetical protein
MPIFVGCSLSDLRYLCFLAYSGIQHILCSVFALFFFVLCTICCQFLWIVHFSSPLRYSLTFIIYQTMKLKIQRICITIYIYTDHWWRSRKIHFFPQTTKTSIHEYKWIHSNDVYVYGVLRHFQQYFSYIVAVSFIVWGKGSTLRKPLTYGKPLTNFIT